MPKRQCFTILLHIVQFLYIFLLPHDVLSFVKGGLGVLFSAEHSRITFSQVLTTQESLY